MSTQLEKQLSSYSGRRDEALNIALAENIAAQKDTNAVKELVAVMSDKKADIRHDVIKVLFETGIRDPQLIMPYIKQFLELFHQKDNWMKWGAMTALWAICQKYPEKIAPYLPQVLDAMDTGSVITRDHGIRILCRAAMLNEHHETCMELLLEQIDKAPVNQVPMYAEEMAAVISPSYVKRLIQTLKSRQDVYEIPTKKKRLDKLIRKLESQ